MSAYLLQKNTKMQINKKNSIQNILITTIFIYEKEVEAINFWFITRKVSWDKENFYVCPENSGYFSKDRKVFVVNQEYWQDSFSELSFVSFYTGLQVGYRESMLFHCLVNPTKKTTPNKLLYDKFREAGFKVIVKYIIKCLSIKRAKATGPRGAKCYDTFPDPFPLSFMEDFL